MTTKVKIEKNVPIPENHRGKWAPLLKSMKVGDSITMKVSYQVAWQNARNSLRLGNFVVRQNGKGFRVWRTK